MATFSSETWFLMAAVAAAGLIAILHTLAKAFNEERKVHDLKIRVQVLRVSYAKRLAEIAGRDNPIEAEVVADETGQPIHAKVGA